MHKIAIIGVGGIGKRHLESVLKSNMQLQIYIVDTDQKTVDEVVASNRNRVVGGISVDILPKEIDVAIIATSSAVRRVVFEQMIEHSTVRNVIFEKVLFQRKEDYYEVDRLLKEKGIRAWVNCGRREQSSYIELKESLKKVNNFTFHLAGGNWGLGCNGIHYLDLIQFLSGSRACHIDNLNLLPVIADSKRAGYKEIFGTILGNCGKCQGFSITCYKDSALPVHIVLSGEDIRYVIKEREQKILVMRQENEWIVEEKEFPLAYVSQRTQRVVENILNTQSCNLPEYDEAMQLHLLYLEPLMIFFEEQGMEKGLCPIT